MSNKIIQEPKGLAQQPYDPAADIRNRFIYHAPSQLGIEKHAALSEMFIGLAELVEAICPAGREKSLVLTKLEEAKFWASAAIARNPVTR